MKKGTLLSSKKQSKSNFQQSLRGAFGDVAIQNSRIVILNLFQDPYGTKKWTLRQAQAQSDALGEPSLREALASWQSWRVPRDCFTSVRGDRVATGRSFERKHLQGFFSKNKDCIKNKIPTYKDIREFDFLSTSRRYSEKRLQMGRSMVEMLGVLAIIGVLSIGALAGYRAAINRHKANSILADVSLGLTDIKTQDRATKDTFDNFNFRTESGYTITGKQSASGYAYVKVENVEESVCEKLLTFKNTGNYGEIYSDDNATNALNECTADALNTMVFAEKNAVAGADNENTTKPACTSDSDCNNQGTCTEAGTCDCDDGWTGVHCRVAENSNVCSDGTVCDEGQICDYWGNCSACGADETVYCSVYDSGRCYETGCCPTTKFVKETVDGFQVCCGSDDQKPYCSYDDGSNIEVSCCSGVVKEIAGVQACCVSDDQVAYCDMYGSEGSCSPGGGRCCSGIPYCHYNLSDGSCLIEDCCSASKFIKETAEGIQACCDSDDQVAYCYSYNSDGSCEYSACGAAGCTPYCSSYRSDGSCYWGGCCSGTPYCSSYNSDGSCSSGDCCSGTPYCSSYNSDGSCSREVCGAAGCTPYCSSYRSDGSCSSGACGAAGCTPYCSEYNSDGSCRYGECCSGVVKETADGVQACCDSDDQEAFCFEYSDGGSCRYGACGSAGCTQYCEYYNPDGSCYWASCCPTTKFLKETAEGVQACCDSDDQVAYCADLYDDGRCKAAYCGVAG